MNNDLINGTPQLLDKGRIRHVHGGTGPARRVPEPARSGSRRTATCATSFSTPGEAFDFDRAATPCSSAFADSRYLSARRLRADDASTESRPLDRGSGSGQRHDLDALLAQRVGVLARGAAADAALLDLAVVDAARFLGKRSPTSSVELHDVAHARAATAIAASSALPLGRARRSAARRGGRRSGAARSAGGLIFGVAAQRAGDAAALARCGAKSSSEANQPS